MTDQPNGFRPDNLPASYDGELLKIGDRRFALTPDEANAAKHALLDWNVEQAKAWEDAQREAGQVWTVTYWQHRVEQTDEGFSLDDAVGILWAGEEWGNLSATGGSIRCPDGTVIEGAAMWTLIRAHGGAVAGVSS